MESSEIKAARTEIILRWILGGLFVFAGVLKTLDPGEFASDIANYQLVPWPVIVSASLYLPWLEIISGFMLIFGPWRAGGLRICMLLMLVFLQALLTAWLRGLNIHCGCFGRAFATSNYALLLLRDLTILGGLSWLLRGEWKRRLAEEAANSLLATDNTEVP